MIASWLLTPDVLGQPRSDGNDSGVNLGPVGSCPAKPSLFIAISDDSGSVTSPGGADPIANRYQEMDRAFTAVADVCRCGHEWAAVLHFDTPGADSGPHPLTHAGLRHLRTGLRVPDGVAGSSQLMPPLTSAIELAHRYPGCDVVLMVFSDFLLADPDLPAVLEALGSFPGTVYACLLGRGPDTTIPGVNRTIALGGTRRAGDVARALMTGLTAHRGSSSAADSHHPTPDSRRWLGAALRARPRRFNIANNERNNDRDD